MKKNFIAILVIFFLAICILKIKVMYTANKKTVDAEPKQTIKPVDEKKALEKEAKKIMPAPIQTPPPPKPHKTSPEKSKEKGIVKNIHDYLDPFIITGGDDDIIEILKTYCPPQEIVTVVRETVGEKTSSLTRENKLNIIFALAKAYKKNKEIQYKLFDIIDQYKNLLQEPPPIIIVAAKTKNSEIIPDIIAWSKKRMKNTNILKNALYYAAKHDDLNTLKEIYSQSEKIQKVMASMASKLLFVLVKNNMGTSAIPFLVTIGGDINYEDPKTQRTLLIQAVLNKNKKMINALMAAGASVSKSSSNIAIGTSLQVSRDIDAVKIENLLRFKYGARDTD